MRRRGLRPTENASSSTLHFCARVHAVGDPLIRARVALFLDQYESSQSVSAISSLCQYGISRGHRKISATASLSTGAVLELEMTPVRKPVRASVPAQHGRSR